MQGVSEPVLGTRPLVRTPSWSRAQWVLNPPSRARPGEPPLWSHFVYLGLGEWAYPPPPPGETLSPRVYSFLPTTNNQIRITNRLAIKCPKLAPLSALGNINSHIQISTILTIKGPRATQN